MCSSPVTLVQNNRTSANKILTWIFLRNRKLKEVTSFLGWYKAMVPALLCSLSLTSFVIVAEVCCQNKNYPLLRIHLPCNSFAPRFYLVPAMLMSLLILLTPFNYCFRLLWTTLFLLYFASIFMILFLLLFLRVGNAYFTVIIIHTVLLRFCHFFIPSHYSCWIQWPTRLIRIRIALLLIYSLSYSGNS